MRKKFTNLLGLHLLMALLTLLGYNYANATGNGAPWDSRFSADAEVKQMRSQNMKHFRNPNGTFTAFSATGSIHYKIGGNWYDINNKIVENNTGNHTNKLFVNATNNFRTYYPSNPFTQTVTVDYNGNTFEEKISSISFLDENNRVISTLSINNLTVPKVIGNQIIYKNIYKDVDLVYTQNNDGKKLDLIINSKSFLNILPSRAKKIAINELVKLPNGFKVFKTENGIELKKNGVAEVSYPNPIAVETMNTSKSYTNENELLSHGEISFTQTASELIVSSSFDIDWIKDNNRTFPIKLDPTANYGPFAVSMATGYMTTATGAKNNGFLRLASTNTFAWSKFNIAGLASTGIISVDSVNYWGYHYTTTGANKIAKITGLDNLDPVTGINTAIVAQINSGPLYNNSYIFGGAAFQWRKDSLSNSLADSAVFNSISKGWFGIGMSYLSGNTTFMYQYGWTGAAGLINYLEVFYQTAPCTNPVAAGNITGNALVCGGQTTNLSLLGASVGSGVTYQWYSSPDSTTWTSIPSATSPAFSPVINLDSIYYRCEVICSFGTPAYTPAYIVRADIFKISPTNPYIEGFESITANNQLPNCMAATGLGTTTLTYTAVTGSYNQAARTGSKYGSFRYGCNDFFFTKGIFLNASTTYSFSTWFVTDGYTGSWDSVALYVATAPNAASATLLPGTTIIQPSNTTYQQLVGSFTPTTSGVYRFAVKVRDAGIPWYLSIDDIKVEVALPPVVQTGTKLNITTTGVTLNGNITSNGGASVTMSGVVIGTSPAPVKATAIIDSTTNPLVGLGNFSVNVSGLFAATTYYYRAYAINPIGITYGVDSSFTTNSSAVVPSVSRVPATNVLAYSATVGGNITSDGGSTVTSSGIVYGTSPNPAFFGTGVVDSTTSPVKTIGLFTINPTGLLPATKYYYRAYAINAIGTAYSTQDSFITAPVVNVFPYLQTYDSVGLNTGWTSAPVTGTLNDWQVGTPAKTTLSAAFSTPTAWITKLTGNYSTSHDAALISPQFDFTTFTSNPILRFKHKFYTESCCDGGFLEISINGGAWTKVENTVGTGTNFNSTNGTGWYNLTTQGNSWGDLSSAYSTAVNGWITSIIALPGAAGQSNVRFRFRFITDTSVEYDGWEIDNVEVFPPTPPTILTGTKTNITTSSVTLGGNITNNGGNNVTFSGVVIGTSPAPARLALGVIDSTTNPLVGNGTFNVNIAGLFPATTYYYRAYAVNAVGTSYGPDSTFITNAFAVAPTVSRIQATNVQAFSATVGGNITSDGGSAVLASGIVYSTSNNPFLFGGGVVDSTTSPVVTTGTYSINPAGLLSSTKYYFRAYATNAIGTGYSALDSFTTQLVISTLPYTENFDGTSTPWTASAINTGTNAWVRGTPAKTNLSGAFSSPNAFVTFLTGNYLGTEDCVILSPQMDFSTLTAAPIFRFKHKMDVDADLGWDGGVVEISIGGGAWTRLDPTAGTSPTFNTTNSIAWYNSTSTSGTLGSPKWSVNTATTYPSTVNGWITSSTPLTGAAGQSNVRVRIRFWADGIVDEGWAVDNIEVFVPTPPAVLTGSKTNITTSSVTLSGNITSNGGNNVTASGIVVSTSPTPFRGATGVIDSASNPLVGTGTFNVNIAGLFTATTYYYRAYAINALGITYGADSVFTTNASAVVPTVLRVSATNIQAFSATVGGNITSDGGSAVTASGVVYGTSPNPNRVTNIDSTTSPVVTTGIYSVNPAGLLSGTKYYFRAYAVNAIGTAYSAQDSFTTAPVISSFPYSENFDGTTTAWTTSAINGGTNAWVRGTPAKTVLSGAYSSPNAMVTFLTGSYLGTEDCVILSPQFNFTSFTTDPVLRFRHKLKTDLDPDYDGGVVEISINGGTWTRLDDATGTGTNYNTTGSYSWYNNSSTSGTLGANKYNGVTSSYASSTSGWVEGATRLTGAAGQNNVKIRFRFWADVFTDEGWAIDDITIVNVLTPTLAPSSATAVPTSGTTANVSWTNGNGNGRIVVARLTSAAAVAPTNNTLYNANAAYGLGDITGTGNFVVYSGTANTVTVTGLANLTNYTFNVYEFNGKYMHNLFTTGVSSSTTTLPVKLISFNGVAKNNDALLNWVTASETNNKGFEVERSIDGRIFELVNFVKGAGNSNKTINYTLTDAGIFSKQVIVYYRLKQIDFEGKISYSQVVRVTKNAESMNSTLVYPNPFNNEYNVSFNSVKGGMATLETVNIEGKVILTKTTAITQGANTISVIEAANLSAGVYFVRLTVDGETQVMKLVKN